MEDECSRIGLEQQVLRAAPGSKEPCASDGRRQLGIDGPAQTPVVHDHAADAPSDHMRLDSATSRFDFRKFWHVVQMSRLNAGSSRSAEWAATLLDFRASIDARTIVGGGGTLLQENQCASSFGAHTFPPPPQVRPLAKPRALPAAGAHDRYLVGVSRAIWC